MRLGNVYFDDECSMCGDVLQCELCREGHGIGVERTNITKMIGCQMRHYEKTLREQKERKSNE